MALNTEGRNKQRDMEIDQLKRPVPKSPLTTPDKYKDVVTSRGTDTVKKISMGKIPNKKG